MHKIHSKVFTLDDFSHEHLKSGALITLDNLIERLNYWRLEYLKTKDKEDWWQMIQLLPSSYNQKRTITMNYENVINIFNQRCVHKLDEWREFCDILCKLPYLDEITTKQDDGMGYTE